MSGGRSPLALDIDFLLAHERFTGAPGHLIASGQAWFVAEMEKMERHFEAKIRDLEERIVVLEAGQATGALESQVTFPEPIVNNVELQEVSPSPGPSHCQEAMLNLSLPLEAAMTAISEPQIPLLPNNDSDHPMLNLGLGQATPRKRSPSIMSDLTSLADSEWDSGDCKVSFKKMVPKTPEASPDNHERLSTCETTHEPVEPRTPSASSNLKRKIRESVIAEGPPRCRRKVSGQTTQAMRDPRQTWTSKKRRTKNADPAGGPLGRWPPKGNDFQTCVECAECKGWVHYACAGITKIPDEHYQCPDCTGGAANQQMPREGNKCARPDCTIKIKKANYILAIFGRRRKASSRHGGYKTEWLVQWHGREMNQCIWEKLNESDHTNIIQEFLAKVRAQSPLEVKNVHKQLEVRNVNRTIVLNEATELMPSEIN